MALTAFESWSRGFVYATGGQLALTTSTVGAAFSEGFLRDSDGRLVVKSG